MRLPVRRIPQPPNTRTSLFKARCDWGDATARNPGRLNHRCSGYDLHVYQRLRAFPGFLPLHLIGSPVVTPPEGPLRDFLPSAAQFVTTARMMFVSVD